MAVRDKEDEGATRACIACAEPIPAAARKCRHCGSPQGWRRFFPFSATLLSLLIALFAVLGQSLSAIRDASHRPGAAIGFALQDSYPQRLAVLVFNDGDRSGTVSRAVVTLPDGRDLQALLGPEGDVQLLQPKSALLANYRVLGDPGAPPNIKARCKLALLISDERGVVSFADRDIPCLQLVGLYPGWRFGEKGEPIRVN